MAEVIGFVTWRRVSLLFKTSLEYASSIPPYLCNPLHMNDGFSVEVKTKKASIFPHL